MIDPMVSLAFSVYSNPGVYALLLGSGISRAAAIPTGWEIINDLIIRIATVSGETITEEPTSWFEENYKIKMSYSEIVNVLAKTESERNSLLKRYIEANDAEREQGLKLPTKAHRAIADLVFKGFIRVIITTNFDRLLEVALQDKGINPIVIKTPDEVDGCIPITHLNCLIIKVHGDYLDTRIKNTLDELSFYDPRIDRLLDRIFDEFGLITCGWSADWDVALKAAISRCPNRRYSMYWAARGLLSTAAQDLATLRGADIVSIRDADTFFSDLSEKVASLQNLNISHPLSLKIAIATVKRYIVDDKNRILLYDFVIQETRRVCSFTENGKFGVSGSPNASILVCEYKFRLKQYEEIVIILQAMIANGVFWGDDSYDGLWRKVLEILTSNVVIEDGLDLWLNLRYYPAMLLFYTIGIASMAAGRYKVFNEIIQESFILNDDQKEPLALKLNPSVIMDYSKMQEIYSNNTPMSLHLYNQLREIFIDIIPINANYERLFDRFEYFYGIVHYSIVRQFAVILPPYLEKRSPSGLFANKYSGNPKRNIDFIIGQEIGNEGNNWAPFKAGFFEGNLTGFKNYKDEYDKFVLKKAGALSQN